MYAIRIKPLSVNKCWKGRRFKTQEYLNYESALMLKLPKLVIPDGDLSLVITVAFSSRASDLDNILKPVIDILQKKYGFNDNRVFMIVAQKLICNKGAEFIAFKIEGI